MEENPLIEVAMQIILKAGDARNLASDALKAAKQFNFELADNLMKEANESLVLAHNSQTAVIQKQMSGEDYDFSMLFIHAQDTLMTIKSEIMLQTELIEMYLMFNNIIKK